ncbi:MAG: hypothetical protein AAF939_04785 [Planctomycetota bacterium]
MRTVEMIFRLLVMILVISGWTVDQTRAQWFSGEANQALSDRNYPWYDSTAGKVQKMEFGERPGSSLDDRQTVKPETKQFTPTPAPAATPTPQSGTTSGISMAIITVVFLILFVAVCWAFFKFGPATEMKSVKKTKRRTIEESIRELPFEMETDFGDFLALAKKAYSNNDFRKATIFLFSYLLVSLDQHQLIQLKKGKTNRQYLAELNENESLANYYQEVMIPFEAAFFGNHQLRHSDIESCWSQLNEFQNQIRMAGSAS